MTDARYNGEVATRTYQNLLMDLSDLGQSVAAAAKKNTDAVVSRLQSSLKDLIWRMDDLKSIFQAIRPVLSLRSGREAMRPDACM